jgi:hypothetical protein
MKKIKNLFLLLLLATAFVACKQEASLEKNEWSDGVITDFDGSLCACCGGYFIEIEGKRYRAWEVPSNMQNFFNTADWAPPLKVRLRWERAKTGCAESFKVINVSEMELK